MYAVDHLSESARLDDSRRRTANQAGRHLYALDAARRPRRLAMLSSVAQALFHRLLGAGLARRGPPSIDGGCGPGQPLPVSRRQNVGSPGMFDGAHFRQ